MHKNLDVRPVEEYPFLVALSCIWIFVHFFLKSARMPNKSLLTSFCHCIKAVRKTLKGEKSAIAVCVKSVLHSRGKTIKRFQCKTRKGKKAFITTQSRKK